MSTEYKLVRSTPFFEEYKYEEYGVQGVLYLRSTDFVQSTTNFISTEYKEYGVRRVRKSVRASLVMLRLSLLSARSVKVELLLWGRWLPKVVL